MGQLHMLVQTDNAYKDGHGRVGCPLLNATFRVCSATLESAVTYFTSFQTPVIVDTQPHW